MMHGLRNHRITMKWRGFAFAAAAIAASGAFAATSSAQGKRDFTAADVDFMQGMIIHHAQAVVMSNWAATHGARSDLLVLCKRIGLSQYDEIAVMQHWLEARHEMAPDPLMMRTKHTGAVHDLSPMHMPGMNMGNPPMMMGGMLTPAEMRQLDASHGVAFDRLYLLGMIKHHQGALDMVADLFSKPGSGQQPELFTLATDIDAGQRVEIARMQAMLNSLPSSPAP